MNTSAPPRRGGAFESRATNENTLPTPIYSFRTNSSQIQPIATVRVCHAPSRWWRVERVDANNRKFDSRSTRRHGLWADLVGG